MSGLNAGHLLRASGALWIWPDGLPAVVSDVFAGVSSVPVFAEIPSGVTIPD